MNNRDSDKQISGFSCTDGDVGYLRAAIWDNKGNELIDRLMEEARCKSWRPNQGQLVRRLSLLDFTAYEKSFKDPAIAEQAVKSFTDFVFLAEDKIEELGEGNVWISIDW